ncbi:MAG: AAA family ATPase [Planctomycetota bacterium]|jgi:predicted ATPase
MIESIQFENFKVLRNTTLPLSRCTILVGPNGSGKSTVLQALEAVREASGSFASLLSLGAQEVEGAKIEVCLVWGDPEPGVRQGVLWERGAKRGSRLLKGVKGPDRSVFDTRLTAIRVFSLDANALAAPVQLKPKMELASNGAGLAGVLDRLRDHHEDRFQALNDELARWLPEFDRITFDLDRDSRRTFLLRTRDGGHEIPAADASQGVLIALAILTLAYLPKPPSMVALEEPDRGIHPRLLRRVKDALYRLSHPESCGEAREAVQVIATTHSPYLLDLFRDHPEEIVICERVGQEVQFKRLSELPNIEDILGNAPLGEIWYSGILGGVPSS